MSEVPLYTMLEHAPPKHLRTSTSAYLVIFFAVLKGSELTGSELTAEGWRVRVDRRAFRVNRSHTVEFDLFIVSERASRNYLWDLMWCKFS